MFRKQLTSDLPCQAISLRWLENFGGLVRTPIIDKDTGHIFVVVYCEQQNSYDLCAIDNSGDLLWKTNLDNGGYGAIALTGSAVIAPTGFTNLAAISKTSGEQVWQVDTGCRVRSPISVVHNSIFFSSGNSIFEVSKEGEVITEWQHPETFFYGTIDVVQDLTISLGTQDNSHGESTAFVFAFRRDGSLAYQLHLTCSPVVSSDTSGIFWDGNRGFVGSADCVYCFNGREGQVNWIARVEGFAGRQVCTVDDSRVYYTTQSGRFGALQKDSGEHLWTQRCHDSFLVSPISVAGSSCLVLADAHLYLLKRDSGQLVDQVAVGRTPYSMAAIAGNCLFIGGGDPPHHGFLIALDMHSKPRAQEYHCSVQCMSNAVESEHVDLLLNVSNTEEVLAGVTMHISVLSDEDQLSCQRLSSQTWLARIPLQRFLCPSVYCLTLDLETQSGRKLQRTFAIPLHRQDALPSQGHVDIPQAMTQKEPGFSGAAIAAIAKMRHGQSPVNQGSLRQMVDQVREKAGYDPFQTWRIVLRRVLTSEASTTEELPEFQL